MNRHRRRAQRAAARHAPADSPVGGTRWAQQHDPTDPRFVLVAMRIPVGPSSMPPAEYTGLDAADRVLRFCKAYLAGAASEGADSIPEDDN